MVTLWFTLDLPSLVSTKKNRANGTEHSNGYTAATDGSVTEWEVLGE